MISPSEIKQLALKWWTPFLQSQIRGEAFFPKQIERIGKVQPGQITARFEILQREIEDLYQHSKNVKGKGYWIQTNTQNFRRTGSHELPTAIAFENIDDYVYCIGKQKDWALFQQNHHLLRQSLPHAQDWLLKHTDYLTNADIQWQEILTVLHYFLTTPRPNLYLRQLPIAVHTKFIEENATLIQSLLDYLIPEHIRSPEQKKFSERFYLRYDEPLIRVRILDEGIAQSSPFKDVSIPLSVFEATNWASKNVLIAENKMNFLTLPALPKAIAIWSGGGFNISYLKNTPWLQQQNIFYWGDIDEHGFLILHQLRSYFPHTQSVMMDLLTYHTFKAFAVLGARNKAAQLSNLTVAEAELYALLQASPGRNRLEQERIGQGYVEQYLERVFL